MRELHYRTHLLRHLNKIKIMLTEKGAKQNRLEKKLDGYNLKHADLDPSTLFFQFFIYLRFVYTYIQSLYETSLIQGDNPIPSSTLI